MRLSKIKTIFQKEILDTLRDRRTLLMMVFLPILLYPGLMLFVTSVATSQQAKMEATTVKVAVVDVPPGVGLVEHLKSETKIEIVSPADPVRAVIEGEIHFLLKGSAELSSFLKEKKTARIKLLYDRSNEDALTNVDRVRRVIDSFANKILKERLEEKSLTEEYVEPLRIDEVNLASKRKMGGFVIGRFLPMLMVFMVLVGALYPSIDMTAGEKERGTLETILTSPATKSEIVVGKFLTVTLIAMMTGLLNLGSMMATFTFGLFRSLPESVQIKIPLSYFLIIIACLIPLAIFFSGIMMAICSFARSFKEAQNMVTPFYLIATIPTMISSIPGIRLEGFWLTFPIANVTLLFKELLLGIFDLNHILIVLFVVIFQASISIFLAIKLFGREEVLFGEASSFGLAFRRSNIIPKPVPESSEALFFSMVALALVLYVAIPLQAKNVVTGLIFTELLIFLIFPIAFALYLKLDLRKTFNLRSPSVRSVLATLLMFLGTALSIGTILYLQNLLFPIPKEVADFVEQVTKQLYERPFVEVFTLLAILPAVCEETSFRGVVLTGMARRYRPLTAMLITAFFFAVFHLSLHRFLLVFLIGLGATFLVLRSGSILVGMLLHMLCNAYVSFLVVYPRFDWLGIQEGKPSPLWFVIGLAFAAFSVAVMNRTPMNTDVTDSHRYFQKNQ